MFQLYAMQQRADTDRLVDLALAAGCEVLILTADTPAPGLRERDLRNGFGVAPRPTAATVRDALAHPRRFGRWLRAAPEPGRCARQLRRARRARWLPQLFDAQLGLGRARAAARALAGADRAEGRAPPGGRACVPRTAASTA